MMGQRPWITQAEAARAMGISLSRLHEAMKSRRMRTRRLYGRRLVHHDDVASYQQWLIARGRIVGGH